MDKQHILDEIKRTAEENGGKPLGQGRFEKETGINQYNWLGGIWASWSDALAAAGFEPNVPTQPISENRVLELLGELIRDLGKYPTLPEMKLRRKEDKGFPSHSTIQKLGTKPVIAKKLLDFCRKDPELNQVAEICEPIVAKAKQAEGSATGTGPDGYVYLIKYGQGRRYKLGRTNKLDRRKYELDGQVPEELVPAHHIKTDDPSGIEAYWQNRWKDKAVKHTGRKKKTEFYDLSSQDVADFKRRKKFM